MLVPILALLTVSLIWGTTFVAVKSALVEVPPFLFLALRFALGAISAAPLLRVGPGLRVALLAGIPLGAILAAGYGFQTLGLLTTTPARSGFLTGLNVLLIPLWGLWILRRRPGWMPILGLLVATVGMWFLARPGAGGWVVGDTWTLGCALFFALHVILLSRWSVTMAPGGLLFSQLATTALLGGVAHLAAREPSRNVDFTQPEVIVALLLTGVLASGLTTWLQMRYQPRMSPDRVALIYATEPLFAALFSTVIWGERLGPTGWIGGGLILAGMLLAELRAGTAREASTGPETGGRDPEDRKTP